MFLRLIRRYTSGEITAHFLTVNIFFPRKCKLNSKGTLHKLDEFPWWANRFHFSKNCSQGYKKLFVKSLERQAVGSELCPGCPVGKHWGPVGHWEPMGWRMHMPWSQGPAGLCVLHNPGIAGLLVWALELCPTSSGMSLCSQGDLGCSGSDKFGISHACPCTSTPGRKLGSLPPNPASLPG